MYALKNVEVLQHLIAAFWRLSTQLWFLHLEEKQCGGKIECPLNLLFREEGFHQSALTSLTQSEEDCFDSNGPLVGWWSVLSAAQTDVQTPNFSPRIKIPRPCMCVCVCVCVRTCLRQSHCWSFIPLNYRFPLMSKLTVSVNCFQQFVLWTLKQP